MSFTASYIHVCSRSDPKLEQCIIENIDNIKHKICEGIPELDIEPNDLFLIDKIIVSDNPNSKISLINAKVSGLCDFIIKFLHVDLDKLHFDVDILFKQIQINATYDFNIRILVPIVQQSKVYITTGA